MNINNFDEDTLFFIREAMIEVYGNTCQYCIEKFSTNKLSVDHIFPKSQGGKGNLGNLMLACILCNAKKNNEILPKWLEKNFQKRAEKNKKEILKIMSKKYIERHGHVNHALEEALNKLRKKKVVIEWKGKTYFIEEDCSLDYIILKNKDTGKLQTYKNTHIGSFRPDGKPNDDYDRIERKISNVKDQLLKIVIKWQGIFYLVMENDFDHTTLMNQNTGKLKTWKRKISWTDRFNNKQPADDFEKIWIKIDKARNKRLEEEGTELLIKKGLL